MNEVAILAHSLIMQGVFWWEGVWWDKPSRKRLLWFSKLYMGMYVCMYIYACRYVYIYSRGSGSRIYPQPDEAVDTRGYFSEVEAIVLHSMLYMYVMHTSINE